MIYQAQIEFEKSEEMMTVLFYPIMEMCKASQRQ